MIIGTGSDLMDMRRMERVLDRFGPRFIARCFTRAEQDAANARRGTNTHIATYAKRFAAKEACSKALGTGIAAGVYLRDIGVVNDSWGRPTLELSGGAAARLAAMVPAGMIPVIHLTLSDEPPLAMAHVIIEAIKPE